MSYGASLLSAAGTFRSASTPASDESSGSGDRCTWLARSARRRDRLRDNDVEGERLQGRGDGAPKKHGWDLYAGCMLRFGTGRFRLNSWSCASVRDRGVGGSNPLAPTNFSRKHWRFLIDMAGDGRSRSGV